MNHSLALLAVLALAASPSPTEPAGGDSNSQVDTVASDSGYVTEVIAEHQEQLRVDSVVDEAGGQVDLGVGVSSGGRGGGDGGGSGSDLAVLVPRGGEFVPVGVCMVSDAGPEVVRLPRCADLSGEEGGDSQGDEPEGEEAEDSRPVVITVTRSDFAELPLEPSVVHLQPERDWFLVNMDTLVYTDGDAQVLQTSVLGVPVAVRATPLEFSWDFGDGSEALVTSDAGAPWPAEDIGHVYSSEASDVVITVTTTWSGQFQVAGQGPWVPIAGTTTTTSESAPFRIEAVETHLTAAG